MVLFGVASPAIAFDTGPHSEITADALSAEGFGEDSVHVAQVNNWFVDLYEQAKANPFSGHGDLFKRLLSTAFTTENWPDTVVNAAWRTHFDNSELLSNTVALTAEWNRLRRAICALAQEARNRNDPELLIGAMGISLHELQDFYAHSNWVESQQGQGVPGSDGPGWQERGFGSYPTWFDVPPAAREEMAMYSDESHGHRLHGFWNTNGNNNVSSGMNKDWPGRPYYMRAAVTAYYASRQWVEAIRDWVGDPEFWAQAQRYRANQAELDHDLEGMHDISVYSGHWQGQGEPTGGEEPGPGGSLLGLRGAIKNYFQWVPSTKLRGRTVYRSRFERLIKQVADWNPPGEISPVPSSQDLQRSTRIVALRVLNMRGEGLGDPGPDQADMFARVRIDGQPMTSAIINDEDGFSFSKPNAPFTWFKVVPATPDEQEPLESVEVEVHTADAAWAGTNDDVFLRLAGGLRLPLDKGLYDDFERNDRDSYSVPIDDAVRKGLRVGDITRVKLEKSPDGFAGGGWKLAGVKLRVNGKPFFDNQHIDRWLEDDHRTWEASDFTPQDPRGTKIPIMLSLSEDDTFYGGDDAGDINPDDNRDTVSIGYTPGAPLQGLARGGNRLGGRQGFGGDGAAITYRLETLEPVPMGSFEQPQQLEFAALPDLVVTEFNLNHITIANQGDGDAGPFRMTAAFRQIQFDGLPAGASETQIFPGINCNGTFFAFVDDLEQVYETDELNNTKQIEPGIC